MAPTMPGFELRTSHSSVQSFIHCATSWDTLFCFKSYKASESDNPVLHFLLCDLELRLNLSFPAYEMGRMLAVELDLGEMWLRKQSLSSA